jgi:Flp pilus assembly pilin Flp
MISTLKRMWNDESGQGLPEYALLVAAVVVMVVAASTLFAPQVSTLFTNIGAYINSNNAIATAS